MLRSLVLAIVLVASTAQAQAPQTVRVRGQIEANTDRVLTIKAREGNTVQVKLADPVTVIGVTKADMADIKANSFVGIASLKGTDNRLYALEVLVFPESSRGSNKGHYPWDLKPDSMMTNATVATVAAAPDGRTVKLTYKGDQSVDIVIPPDVPIVTFVPGSPEMLKAGTHIFIGAAVKNATDGSLSAGRVLAGADGLVPPM